jgi:HlyD family secretion protein
VVTYTAIISAPNPDLLLFPGMTAVLQIAINDSGKVLKIPNEALRFHPETSGSMAQPNPGAESPSTTDASAVVWTIGEVGRPTPVPVKIGLSDDTGTQLLEGSLLEGEPVIVGVSNSQTLPAVFGIRIGF